LCPCSLRHENERHVSSSERSVRRSSVNEDWRQSCVGFSAAAVSRFVTVLICFTGRFSSAVGFSGLTIWAAFASEIESSVPFDGAFHMADSASTESMAETCNVLRWDFNASSYRQATQSKSQTQLCNACYAAQEGLAFGSGRRSVYLLTSKAEYRVSDTSFVVLYV